MKKIIILLAIATTFFACKEETKTPVAHSEETTISETAGNIFANYYIRYLADGRQIKAEATFYEGEKATTAKPITMKGGVAFLGSGMEAKNLQNQITRYSYLNVMDYPTEFNFSHQGKDGTAHLYNIDMPASADFEVLQFSLSKGLKIDLKSAPLEKNEAIVAIVNDAKDVSASIEIRGTTSILEVSLEKYKDILTTGKGEISLVRKKIMANREGNYDTKGTVEYYSKAKNVTISN